MSTDNAAPASPDMTDPPKTMGQTVWRCKIGVLSSADMPLGSDVPMRRAIQAAFYDLTGKHAEFTFSGWGAQLTPQEVAVVRNTTPPATALAFDLDTEMNAFFNATKDEDDDEGQRAQDAICEAFAALRASLETAEADSERLDWLDANPSRVSVALGATRRDNKWSYTVSAGVSYETRLADSLREAIDAARATSSRSEA